MMKRLVTIPAMFAAVLAMLVFMNPLPAQTWWEYDYYGNVGYYDDELYEDDWYYDYYTYDYDDDDFLVDSDDWFYIYDAPYEERATAFDDAGDEGWLDV